MQAFQGNLTEGLVIDHIDGDRLNNKLENLREVTQSENQRASYRLGRLVKTPDKSATRKLKSKQVQDIRLMNSDGVSTIKLAKLFCVNKTTISNIVHLVTYKDI